jgi:predicted phosphodiesterase
MILTVIGDCNGHADALRAALDWIAEEGILSIFCTGNLAGGAQTDAVIALLKAHEVVTAQGARDRLLLRYEQKAQQLERKLDAEEYAFLSAAHAELSSGSLEHLRGLHKTVERSIDGIKILACHGSPSSQGEVIDIDSPTPRLQRLRESVDAQIFLCGGADGPFHRWVDGVLFVGPGPLLTAQGEAAITIVDTEEEPWQVRVQLVPVVTAE